MAIIQISKLQARSGNLVDLPQLDEAEFAWASDDKRLFIGKTSPNENIEVLTSYSNISYSQITGSVGNLNINPATVANGQPLVYDGTNWVNRGGTAGGLITLGTASNVKITGGAIGYVLETDGLGNLAWTPKGSLYTNIIGLSNATPIVMTVANTTPFTNDLQVTISGANGVSNSIVNGQSFYIQLAVDFPTSGNVSLYTGTGGTGPVAGTGLTYTNSPNAIATSIVAGSGGGGAAQGANTSIQYNNGGAIDGSADLTWDFGTAKLFTVNGNANVGNLNATGVGTATRFISNIATGTTPIQVVSTTRVANLNVSYANVADFEAVTTQTTGTFYPVFVSGNTSANYALGSNANISVNVATGTLSASLLTGTLTTAAQPNVTSVGTLTSLTVGGSITPSANITYDLGNNTNRFRDIYLANSTIYLGSQTINANATSVSISGTLAANISGNVIGSLINGNSNVNIPSANGNVNISAVGNANILIVTGTGVTITGTLSTGTGNANVGNLGTTRVLASANITSPQLISNVATGTAPFVVSSTTQVANLSVATAGLATYATTANAVAGANVSGTVANATYATSAGSAGSATTAGTVTTAAQPNITSVGTLTSLTTTTITTGSNVTAGTFTGNWTLTTGSRLQATYADLAEYYTADAIYLPGTVLAFGGDQEVTIATDETNKVAGVVTTNPAFIMNEACKGPAVAIALQGRVPCKVTGTIHKGDMMVSAGNGYAKASSTPAIGTVIGKSLENFDGIDGIIEVAIGKT